MQQDVSYMKNISTNYGDSNNIFLNVARKYNFCFTRVNEIFDKMESRFHGRRRFEFEMSTFDLSIDQSYCESSLSLARADFDHVDQRDRLGRTVSWRGNDDRERVAHRRVEHEGQYVGRISLQQGFRDTLPPKCDRLPEHRMWVFVQLYHMPPAFPSPRATYVHASTSQRAHVQFWRATRNELAYRALFASDFLFALFNFCERCLSHELIELLKFKNWNIKKRDRKHGSFVTPYLQ